MARNSKQWADLSSKMCANAGAQTLYVSEIVADLKSAIVYRAAIDFQLCTLVALHAIAARILHLCQETSLLEMAGRTSGRRHDGLQRQHRMIALKLWVAMISFRNFKGCADKQSQRRTPANQYSLQNIS